MVWRSQYGHYGENEPKERSRKGTQLRKGFSAQFRTYNFHISRTLVKREKKLLAGK